MNSVPSIEAIKTAYFRKQDRATRASARDNRALSATTHYIVQEARQHLLEAPETGESRHENLEETIRFVEQSEQENLTEREREQAVLALQATLQDYDILTPLVRNNKINDIIIRAHDDISIQTARANVKTDYAFSSHATYCSFIENLLKRVGKSCTTATPVVDAAVDPNVRACVTHESFSPAGSGPMLTLRIARHLDVSIDNLVSWELAPPIMLSYLSTLVRETDATILIAGEVATGKTTLVRALAAEIPAHEAILCIEDTHEIALERNFVRTLLTREANTEGAGKITPADAIRTGMRMAMNRIILGEMRDAEAAEAFIDVCASGHPGFSTIHARSAKDAIGRLELFLARAQPHVETTVLKKQLANAISVVVYLAVDKKSGKRQIREITEVQDSAGLAIQLAPMFQLDTNSSVPNWKRLGGISKFGAELEQARVGLPAADTIISLNPEMLYRNLH